ncbi:MAG: hypothetical protein IKE94_15985 [Aeriscardovia sp.]|nr:hypothetical protein [Aeriscardovia sp.]
MTINNGEQVIDLAKALGAMAKEADMVCVVRCKDCKHRHLDGMIWNCPFGLSGGEDFFCAYGAKGGDADGKND